MLSNFRAFLKDYSIKTNNHFFNFVLKKFSYYIISKDDLNIQNYPKKNNLDIIIVDKSTNFVNNFDSDSFFIICFDYSIILIQESNISDIFKLFSIKQGSTIYCISDDIQISNQQISNFNQQKISIQKVDINDDLRLNYIPSFQRQIVPSFSPDKKHQKLFWTAIKNCFFGFLIKVAFDNSRYDRITHYNDLFSSKNREYVFSSNEYLKLKCLNVGISDVYLVYLFKKEQVCVLKIFKNSENKNWTLFEREHENYLNIHHPLLPRYFGKIESSSDKCLLFEFLEGSTLEALNLEKLSAKIITKIILEIMIVLEYFHCNGYVYRDLKPNNIVIDKNYSAYIIDFDRLIKNPTIMQYEFTKDFAEDGFKAPEINKGDHFSNKADVYSLGMIIKYIIQENSFITDRIEFSRLQEIINKSTSLKEEERPNISELIDIFYCDIFSSIHHNRKAEIELYSSYHNELFCKYWFLISEYQYLDIQSKLSDYYFYGFYILKDSYQDIQYASAYEFKTKSNYIKFISPNVYTAFIYFLLSANQNSSNAQMIIGVSYFRGEYNVQDISKGLYYLTLSSNQNNQVAQSYLGNIYENGIYIKQDINKAIHYYLLAANQNDEEAQFRLGYIYFTGKCGKRDIKKAFQFFSLAANNNDNKSQFFLGAIYENGEYIDRDINKAFYYYSLAAEQNNKEAQFKLGVFFYEGKYIKKDINKAIHYFSLAANQNESNSQFNLGLINYEGIYVSRDIDKAVYYFLQASNQNNPEAQFYLGVIFSTSKYDKLDINKAIFYYSLAAENNISRAQYNLGLIYYEGKYIPRDINKAIYYFSLASDKNIPEAQYNIGIIFSNGKYIPREMNKAIYYYSLAAKQNDKKALYNLGMCYYDGKFGVQLDIPRAIHYFSLASKLNHPESQSKLGIIYSKNNLYFDINKAIYYFSLAANQNIDEAQFNLGKIYLEGKHVKQDLNKAIHYFSLAEKKNNPEILLCIGMIYFAGLNNIKVDFNKSIYYFTLASNQGHPYAQYILGMIYFYGFNGERNVKKGVYYLMLSSINGYHNADFYTGCFYFEGKYIQRNITQSIHYFKEASSFYSHYAKINLGILYKNGFGNECKKNLGNAITYFKEAIRLRNDKIALYNLAHLYFYEETIKNIDKSIELLMFSALQEFDHSILLLCVVLIAKHQYNIERIKKEFDKFNVKNIDLQKDVCKAIKIFQHHSEYNYKVLYERYRNFDFYYNPLHESVPFRQLKYTLNRNDSKIPNISNLFYEGFGFDI